jgi:hypothetical protein
MPASLIFFSVSSVVNFLSFGSPFALCSWLFDNAVNAFIKTFRGEMKWQTYQFVRNQMVRI